MTANWACAARLPKGGDRRELNLQRPWNACDTSLGRNVSPGALTRDPLVKGRQPLSGLSTVQRDELIHEMYRAGTSRDHRQLGIEALEIQLAHQTLMSLFHEETARAGFEFNLHEPEIPLGEGEVAYVILRTRIRIGEEDLGRGLFDERPTDWALQHIAGALRRERHDAV